MAEVNMTVPAETKKPWESKTLWTNVLLGIAALGVPGLSPILKAHPEIITYLFMLLNIVLRLISSGKISLQD